MHYRLWKLLGGRWPLETPIHALHAEVPGIEGINFPDVCPEQPHKSTIFCTQHLAVALNKGYLTDLKGFLAFCGSKPDNGMFALN